MSHKTCRFQWVFKRLVQYQVLYCGIQTHLLLSSFYPRPSTIEKNRQQIDTKVAYINESKD